MVLRIFWGRVGGVKKAKKKLGEKKNCSLLHFTELFDFQAWKGRRRARSFANFLGPFARLFCQMVCGRFMIRLSPSSVLPDSSQLGLFQNDGLWLRGHFLFVLSFLFARYKKTVGWTRLFFFLLF